MVKPKSKAKELWDNPRELIDYWALSSEKVKQEQQILSLVRGWLEPYIPYNGAVMNLGDVVDLGCGAGRYAQALLDDANLDFTSYSGFDGSTAMVDAAKGLIKEPRCEFSCVDLYKFQSDIAYDVAFHIDVLHHQENPVAAIRALRQYWTTVQTFVTLLVGQNREQLYSSTVIDYDEFLTIIDEVEPVNMHINRFDQNDFSWVVLHL